MRKIAVVLAVAVATLALSGCVGYIGPGPYYYRPAPVYYYPVYRAPYYGPCCWR